MLVVTILLIYFTRKLLGLASLDFARLSDSRIRLTLLTRILMGCGPKWMGHSPVQPLTFTGLTHAPLALTWRKGGCDEGF